MTLLEIRNQLLNFFLSTDSFVINSDCKKIKVPKEQEKFKRELIETVLIDLSETGFCKGINTETGWVYVAILPLAAENQQLELSNATANFIGEILDQYIKSNDVKDYTVDRLAITDNDIRNLCKVTSQLMDTQDKGPADEEKDI